MKVKLTEAQIRSLLRERIARRLLMEEAPPPAEPQQSGGIGLSGITAGLASAAVGGLNPLASHSPTAKYTKYGMDRSLNRTAVEAIGQLTGAQTYIGPDGAQFGPGAGEAIDQWQAKHADWMKKSIPFSGKDPLVAWKRNSSDFSRVPGFNPGTGGIDSNTSISLPDDARGLLAYLLLVQEGATGLKKAEEIVSLLDNESDLNATIDGWVETFKMRNLVSGADGLRVAEELYKIVSGDSGQRNCFRTRYALAKFAQKNTKYGETNLLKAIDLGLWALTIAEFLPAATVGTIGVGIGTGLRGARFSGLAEPLADDALRLGTVAASRERVAAQLAASGEKAVAGARAASSAAELAAREKALSRAMDVMTDARGAADDAERGFASLIKSMKDDVAVADDLVPARDKIIDGVSSGKLDLEDANGVADEIIELLPETPPDGDPVRFAASLSGEIEQMTNQIGQRLRAIETAKGDLEAAKKAAQVAEEEAKAAKFEVDTLKNATSPAPLKAGREEEIARRAKFMTVANPVSQSKLVFMTARDFAAATGIRGLLGAITVSGISTTALSLLAFSGWARLSIARDKLELLSAMAVPDLLGELADEFTNTFFVNYSIAEGIDDVEDAIYEFASKAHKPAQGDLTHFKNSLRKGIAYAKQAPEETDQDEETQ